MTAMHFQSLSSLDVLLCASGIILLYKLYSRLTRTTQFPYPPGPSGYPLIGHLKGPDSPNWVIYRDWSRQYQSDIIHLNMVGTNLVVLNSFESCKDLLVKRSSIYSDRPSAGITMVSELCGLSWSFGIQRYGPEWRDGRKAFQSQLNATAVKKHRAGTAHEMHRFLCRIVADPEAWAHSLDLMVGGLIMTTAYGIDVQEHNDPYLEIAEHAAECVRLTLIPGAYLVDLLPIMKYIPDWFPGAKFQRDAKEWRKWIMRVLNEPYNVVKQRMVKDPAATPDCVTKSLMETMVDTAPDPAYMERIVQSAVGSMYLAAFDTTLSTITSFILAIVLNPDVQRKARDSIDQVVQNRLPDFSDFDNLPYVDALVRESLRWNPVVGLNLPHRCTTDDIYREYLIPKDSIVVANIWAILHDPAVYPDPETFNPERFLHRGPDGKVTLNPSVPDPMDAAFGFGRRVCPGRFMGYESIWLTVACLLSAFNIDNAKDENGKPIGLDGEYVWGLTSHPKPFRCSIRARSKEHEALILQTTSGALDK